MPIIDTHAHLNQIEEVEQVLREAATAELESIVAVSEDLASSQRNLELSRQFSAPKIFVAMGLHPGKVAADNIEPCLQFVAQHIRDIQAIGETGLDFWYPAVRDNDTQKGLQRESFGRHLELARTYNLPVVIHSRGAWRESLDMARDAGVVQAVFHWYSGPVDVLKDILSAGYLISASPSLAYSRQLRDAVRQAPVTQTLIETDCPVFYRLPTGNGFVAAPKDVWRTLQAYAEIKNVVPEQVVSVLNQNARDFFRLQ